MDDVSRFQKITNIARELLDKGQAQSMQEAMKIAQNQIDNGEHTAAKQAEIGAQPITPESIARSAPEPEPSAPSGAPVASMPPAQRTDSEIGQIEVKINKIIETVNIHTTQMQNFEKKINSIIADLAAMKDDIRRMKENPVTAPPLKARAASAGQTQFKEEAQPAAASAEVKSDGTGHVRSGNYKSDDVSIEKFFYYGNR